MASHNEIYLNQADAYEFMISKQPELAGIVNEVRPYKNLDVLDLGAGSGRLSSFIAKEAKSLICTDQSSSMLQLLNDKLKQQGLPQLWSTIEADHRNLPIPDSTIDLVVSGWSICYLANTNNENWEANLETIMSELERVLRSDGTIIIFETMGTGTELPNPPNFLTSYYSALSNKYRFNHRWIRMDYDFNSVEEASAHTQFFFGEELAKKIENNQWATVPECAGIWWKHL